jgi:L-lysine exporter family protein LysE/ArgO
MITFWEGFLLGLGLLVALGPKDIFVIKNSFTGDHTAIMIAICSLSDMILIVIGIFGLGAAVTNSKWLMIITMMASIGYLLYFSARSFWMLCAGAHQPMTTEAPRDPRELRSNIVKGALFHSLLTPYAWIDTVLVIGSISATKYGNAKYIFASGAMAASLSWFIFLAVGSRFAAPFFKNRLTWQALDLVVAISMLTLSIQLAMEYPWYTSNQTTTN